LLVLALKSSLLAWLVVFISIFSAREKVSKQLHSLQLQIKRLPHELRHHIVGQHQAVDAVVRAIKNRLVGISCDPKAPIANLLFLGPTGIPVKQAKFIACTL